jgi:glycosyltransferase involved in cell wall biosynthesis
MKVESKNVLICLPCFNVSDTIIKTLESVRAQSSQQYILVVCDDASTDNSLSVIKQYKKDLKFDLIKNKKNLGTGRTVNKIIKHALKKYSEIEFITWISGDNTISENFVKAHVNKLSEGYAITYSDYYHGGSLISVPVDNWDRLKSDYQLGPSFMFRKKLWLVVGSFHNLPGEDYYFAVDCAINEAKIGIVREALTYYLDHDNSVGGRLRRGEIVGVCSHDATNKAAQIKSSNGTKIYD